MYGVEAAGASPAKVAKLTAAVIDVFKSRNNNHNANQFFSTITRSKHDLDPQAHMFARRVLQVRRTAFKKSDAAERFRKTIRTYATKHKRNGKWPVWFQHQNEDEPDRERTFPDEQPHPSTGEHDENWDQDICAMGPIGLLIESTVWHGFKIDDSLKLWQKKRRTHQHTRSALPKLETSGP